MTNTSPVEAPVETRGKAVVHARNSNIVVELLTPVKSAGGLILPGAAMERIRTAMVVSVGDGILCNNGERIAITLRVGDLVALRPGRGMPFPCGGRHYLVVDQAEIPVVYRAEDGGILTDVAKVDPLTIRRSANADLDEASTVDGTKATESVDGQCADAGDQMRDEVSDNVPGVDPGLGHDDMNPGD